MEGIEDNWKSIGEALRLRPKKLKSIENEIKDKKRCLGSVLNEWLEGHYDTKRFGAPTWKLLVTAVAHPAGGRNSAFTLAECEARVDYC